MTRKGLRKHEFYLSPDVMDIILEVSSQRDVQLDKGLSQIVLEWKAGIERKPLTTKSPELSDLQKDDIHMKLSKQFNKIHKNNQLSTEQEYIEDRLVFLENWFSTLYNEIMELPIWNDEAE